MQKLIYSLIIFLFVLFGCNNSSNSSEGKNSQRYVNYRSNIFKNQHLNDSFTKVIVDLPNDTLKRELLFEISYNYLKQNDSLNFRKWNLSTLKISSDLNDSTKIAESYWDLASFWYARNILDSAYYNYNKAYNLYNSAGDNFQASRMMLSMGIIQKDIRDYIGSEISTINALKKFLPLKKYDQVYSSYNNLAVINNELGDYERSLGYHQNALQIEEEINNPLLRAATFNNIGVVYRNKKNYERSIDYFTMALDIDSLYSKDISLYAMLIDNLFYSKLKLGDTINVKENLLNSLRIRDSINYKSGIIINKLHLVDYYLFIQDTLTAETYLKDAKWLSEKYKSYGDLQDALLILSKIDNKNSNKYYLKYISISDSLSNRERLLRNKFARIRFETDQYISENKYLNKRNRNMLWIIIATILLFTTIYIIRNQKVRFDKLKMANLQQAANEEIYNLLLISQNKLDEGREKEKKRISKELHDGILSKFFGVRLNLEILNDGIDLKSIKERNEYLQELKNLELEIRSVSHKLNEDISSLDNNFLKVLNELFHEQSKIGNFHFDLEIDEKINWEEISNRIKINIYRIIQEGIHNINKYAEADIIKFILELKNFNLMILLEDNGVGFDLGATSDGIGLSNMKSRIGDLSGKIKFDSDKSGTKISMEIPIKNT